MKKVLYISLIVPFDNRKFAGSKSHNFYVKNIVKNKDISLKLLSFAHSDDDYEEACSDLKKYNIDAIICKKKKGVFAKIYRGVFELGTKFSPFDKNGNFTSNYYKYMVMKNLKLLKKQGYIPDVIIVEWTQLILFGKKIKSLFRTSKLIAIEQDVSYLGYLRKYKTEKNMIKKLIRKNRYNKLKISELKALAIFDLILTLNYKDRDLLIADGTEKEKVDWISPWFNDYSYINRNIDWSNPYIIFFGAMSRPENYLSVIWFIDNVFVKLQNKIDFFIIGGNPPKELIDIKMKHVHVLGYVENIEEYFSGCLAMVAPLVLGAGIKVKILEAMSAGIPILTNNIGIEGIPATENIHYFNCNNIHDYIKYINKLLSENINYKKMIHDEKSLIVQEFNIQKSAEKLFSAILNDRGKQ